VQRLAVLLDHPVSLRSHPQRGSCFSLRIKRLPGPFAELRPALPVASQDVRLGGTFVLVVDDDAEVRLGTRALLEQWGCIVADADSATSAVQELDKHDRLPDLMICDHLLPGSETGLDLIRMIRRREQRDIAALLVTGDSDPATLHGAEADGLLVLRKPVAAARLHSAVLKLTETHV
jgi:CheY-like chemotaxis protein